MGVIPGFNNVSSVIIALNFNGELFFPPSPGLVLLIVLYPSILGTAVAQWLGRFATNREVAGSIPADVSGFFIDIKSFPIALWPWGRLSL